MTALSSRYQQAASALLEAYHNQQLGHDGQSPLNVLLGGSESWMDAIDPILGSIDLRMKQDHPQVFDAALKAIESSDYSIEEIIQLEARFSGRKRSVSGQWLSTLDDDNDPDAGIGFSQLLSRLEEMDAV